MQNGQFLIICSVLLLTVIGISGFCCTAASDNKYGQIKDTLSSDLLQILSQESCPPGLSAQDVLLAMEKNGQIRWDNPENWSVHVTITFDNNRSADELVPYIQKSALDPSYHLITGWVTSSNLSVLAGMDLVRSITPVFPPVSSGSLEIIPEDQETFSVPDTFWKTKLSTDLLQLIDDQYLSPGQSKADIMAVMEKTGEIRIADKDVEIRISAKTNPSVSPDEFAGYFSHPVLDKAYGRIGGWISPSNITLLAMEDGIISLVAQIPPRTSEIRTEGDYILQTRELRNISGLNGTGIKVGIISDGVDGLDRLQEMGELPDVQVLSDTVGGDEGLAMLQIVHDIAPNATLYFHDRGSSQIEFVHALDKLIIKGCDIICDDITYVEPFFEDGYVSQNIIDRILSYDILYITAAGNFAQEHYQAPFTGYDDQGYLWQDFNSSSDRDMHFTIPAGLAGHVILQWDDPFGSSANNYDLFLYDESGREIARSVNLQDGSDDPMEWVRFVNSDDTPRNYTVRVVQAAADNALLEIYVLPLSGRSVHLDPSTPEDSVFGQQAVSQALVVGAAAPDPENITAQEYSSRGPVLIRYPSPELREKPDLVAPDHITVLTGGMQRAVFTGTSAAAPHIAGLAALVWSADPDMKESEVRDIILNNTISPSGIWDPAIGLGMPWAQNLDTVLNKSTISVSYPVVTSCNFEPRVQEQFNSIFLYPGWNMISIPYPLLAGNTTKAIFKDVNTAAHTLWRYNSARGSFIPLHPDDELLQMDVVWVYSQDSYNLTLPCDSSGTNQTVKQLIPGWNPVGVPGKESITAEELLSPLADSWTNILVFDPKTQQYRPTIINGGIGIFSSSRLLYPSEGWWIYMTRPGILFPVC